MKVRVYELAKEAGMDSKVLATKLIELGYDVKSYSSSLDEDMAAEIRQRLLSTHTEVQEKRIQAKGRTTIIRRRTKSVPNLDLDAVPVPSEMPENVESGVSEPPLETEAEEKSAAKEEEVVVATPEPVQEKEAEVNVEAQEEQPAAPPVEEIEPPLSSESEAQASVEEPSEQEEKAAVPEKEEAEEPEPEPEPEEPVRKGFARVIKRAAIKLPVEEARPRRPAKRPGKPQHHSQRSESNKPKGGAGKVVTGQNNTQGKDKEDGKGKKGKRFVKFHHHTDPGARQKKTPGRRRGYGGVDMEDVAMVGGRFSAALKVGRGGRGGASRKNKSISNLPTGETKAIKMRIKVYDSISIGDLAHKMGVKVNELIVKLMGLGVMATVNQTLDIDTATLVASDFGYDVELAETEETNILNLEEKEVGGEMVARPPVVTVMGHVDHGKTSILDAIRNTDVAEGEAGGITQHIGAHYVRSAQGDVVFLDTPGHAAFTEMRSRGAQVTDIVVLVVAADDGVMDQTKEAINHAKAAEVPIVVAVNKIDKDGADPMRVKRELAEYELVPEDWGGSTIFCEVSAKQNIGIEELLEQILLQSEILELKADPERRARGRVVEAKLHKGRGPLATILVQQGTVRVGDIFVVGEFSGKVRSLRDDKGAQVEEGGPSMPVEVQGLGGVPMSGDEFVVVPDEKMAKNVSAQRQMKSRESLLGQTTKISLDNLFDKLQEGEMKELCVLLRADVRGTLEAFGKAIDKLATDAIRVKILHQGTGTITDSDILLASASNAIIIGFNVRPSAKVQDFATSENVDLRFYDVIYHALDDIKKAMIGMLDPTFEERVIGGLEVRDTFSVPKIGTIAGCFVTNGKIERSAKVRLIRDGVVIFTGSISSLRRFKDDVKEVQTGYECGVGIENYNDVKVEDTMEVFVMDEVAGEL